MDIQQLRIDAAAAARLGDAVKELARTISTDIGECVVCHAGLGSAPVSLAVHESSDVPAQVLVLPGHAACQPAGYTKHDPGYQPLAPAPTYQATSFPVPTAAGSVLAVLVNPSVDVLVGEIGDDGWRGQWEHVPQVLGVSPLASMEAVVMSEPQWGAEVSPRMVTLKAPGGGVFQAPANEAFMRLAVAAKRVLVFVSDVVLPTEDGALDRREFTAAAAAGRLYTAWAGLGGRAVEQAIPERSPRAQAMAASGPLRQMGARALDTTGKVEREFADVRANLRAMWTDHPVIGMDRVVVPGMEIERVPVLLVESARAVMSQHADQPELLRELRCEGVIAAGMERALLAPGTVLSQAREWVLVRSGVDVELVNPAKEVIARGQMRKWPPGWLDSAGTIGSVLVMFGAEVGVRSPKGRSYNDIDRRAELLNARIGGRVAWGLVAWNGA
ncbi:hypothetical protein AB0I28_32675 [Phytomonospora sp. NPDC050363]|uniref:hypothetical protein n=1 Tax=Phytomonospora sp. NPDC050363 TaxID=3155642 RepID=UPI00340117EC